MAKYGIKIWSCLLVASLTLALNGHAAKGLEIKHKTQLCCAQVYWDAPNRTPTQEQIDKSNRERKVVTYREHVTLTIFVDGQELPADKECTWTPDEGKEYFTLEQDDDKPGQTTVIVNCASRAKQQKISVKAELDGMEQTVEFTIIPPEGLVYSGARSPYPEAVEAGAALGCTEGLTAFRALHIHPFHVSFGNLFVLEAHRGYVPDPLPDHPLVLGHTPAVVPVHISTTNGIYDQTCCLYPREYIDAFTGKIEWTWKCYWSVFGCMDDEVRVVNGKPEYMMERMIFGFATNQIFEVKRDPVTHEMSYKIQKFEGLNKKDNGVVIAPKPVDKP